MTAIQQFIFEDEGQSTVEYMLLISVIVIAILAAAYTFVEPFQKGIQELAKDVSQGLASGSIGDIKGVH